MIATLLGICLAAFTQVRVLDELPNMRINDFYQDRRQFVWISTDYGISRFNGTDYVTYFHSSSDSTSLPSNRVICTREDARGRLWVLTDAGICRFEGKSGRFRETLRDNGLCGMLSLKDKMVAYGHSGFVCVDTQSEAVSIHGSPELGGIRAAAAQGDSLIWAVTEKESAILCYDLRFNRVGRIDPVYPEKTLCAAVNGRTLWLGTEKGVWIFDLPAHRFVTDDLRARSLGVLRNASVSFIYTHDGDACIGTSSKDVYLWDKGRWHLTDGLAGRHFIDQSSTSDFSCALRSSDGQWWIGTSDRGYSIYSPSEIEFCRGKTLKRITKGKYFNGMTVAADSVIWAASRYKGLMSVDAVRATHLWYKFVNDPELNKLGKTGLTTVFCDRSQTLWLNMEDKLGVAQVSGLTLGTVQLLDQRLRSRAICQDAEGDVWIAAEDGLYRFRDREPVQRLFYGSVVEDVTAGPDGKVYCCLPGIGVMAVNPGSGEPEEAFRAYRFTQELNALRFHPDGSAWFATGNDGIYVLDGETLSHYGRQDGLSSPDVESVVFDRAGNAWLGTSYGLSLVRKGDRRISSYKLSESLQVQQFTARCAVAAGDFVCLGGVSGLALFASGNLIAGISDKPVDLSISSLMSRGQVLDECLKGTDDCFDDLARVTLPHRFRDLTIAYEAVQYYHPEAVSYAYRMKGLEKEWHYVDDARSANWSHLPAGRYTFELMARNYDGYWNTEPKRLDIVIRPSPFLSWYALLLYLAALVFAISRIIRSTVERRMQKERLDLAMEALEQEKKVAGMKVDFFSNISHELRTSLSLVYGPASMLEKADEKERKGITELIRTNANNLLALVDQLLNISRIENDCLPLAVSDTDIVPCMKRMIRSFEPLADGKDISITLIEDDLDGVRIPVDVDKFQAILQNLLSNAVKYTGNGGHVVVKAGILDGQKLRVSVIDDGIGMSEEEAKTVFDRYVRLKSGVQSGKGNGIGLHYVQQLVRLHKGEVRAIVRDCGGMEFRFEIPVSQDAYSAEERQEGAVELPVGALGFDAVKPASAEPAADGDSSKPLVAVIEDNPQLSAYLKHILASDFRVITAGNAQDGLDLVTAAMPDIITTDVMMQGMDGYELCRKIKDDPILSHIPVVILTARVSEEDKISGFKSKANAYITKPFSPELLLTVLRNLIEEVNKLRKAILSPDSAQDAADSPVMSEHDSRFLSRLNEIIDRDLSAPLGGTAEMAEIMQISRSTFFRKMKALTGVSPNEYVVIYKLNKSIEMLRRGEQNISEIAYSLGFSSPSHFSNTFKARFGVSPRNYQSQLGL